MKITRKLLKHWKSYPDSKPSPAHDMVLLSSFAGESLTGTGGVRRRPKDEAGAECSGLPDLSDMH